MGRVSSRYIDWLRWTFRRVSKIAVLIVLFCFLLLLSQYVYSECCAVFRFVSRSYCRSFWVWFWECWSWSWRLVWFVRWYYVICSLMFLCHTCNQWWRRTVGDCGVRSTMREAVSWVLWVFLYRELCCLESTVLHFSVFYRCLKSLFWWSTRPHMRTIWRVPRILCMRSVWL